MAVWRGLIVTFALLALGDVGMATEKPAKLEVSGYGFWGNRELKRALRLIQGEKKPPPVYDASFIEDGALILLARLRRDGYLEPELTVRLSLADGAKLTHTWDTEFDSLLPRPLSARKVEFQIDRGVLYYYERVEFTGLEALDAAQARRFFYETDFLVPLRSARIFTPERRDNALAALTEALARKGYEDARVTVADEERDDETGAVRLRVAVEEGLPSVARSVEIEVYGPDGKEPKETDTRQPGKPFSRFWRQDLQQELRTDQYRQGYPDATAELKITAREETATNVLVDVLAQVRTGPRITVGDVRFQGHKKTKESVLDRRVKLESGDYLDRTLAEQGRYRLSRLGIFDSVGLSYDEVEARTRDVVYELDESKVIDFSLLFGYGSYEQLRGGFELEQHNLFGRAHQSRLRAVQSFKSTSADYLYTMPELIGEDVTVFFNASGLRREETSFVREEYGAGVGAQRHFRSIDSDIGLRYNYELLNANDPDVVLPEGVRRARVASFVLDLRHDRRDNPLLPRRGHKLFTTLELASASLGGQVDFQRLELGTSVHFKLGGGRFLHLGVSHGAALTLGGGDEDLPFNKRFFPGGESSIRGYQQGEASPLDAEGDALGAETYLLGNIELEQVLTPSWSLVVFFDAVGFAEDVSNYPFDEKLYSAGGGIRWKTIVGPVRLEYGHNLNPRRDDPDGTLHLSIGFPF